MECIIRSYYDDLISAHGSNREELKDTMRSCINGCYVIRESNQRWPQFVPWLTKDPPSVSIALPVICFSLWFYRSQDVLVYFRKTLSNLALDQSKEVNNH